MRGIEAKNTFIVALRKSLMDSGYKVESPSKIVGMSGVEHVVDLYSLSPHGTRVILEVEVSDSPVDAHPVLSTYIKVLDTNVKGVLAVMPSATSSARDLAASYKITLIEGMSTEDVISRAVEAFTSITSQQYLKNGK